MTHWIHRERPGMVPTIPNTYGRCSGFSSAMCRVDDASFCIQSIFPIPVAIPKITFLVPEFQAKKGTRERNRMDSTSQNYAKTVSRTQPISYMRTPRTHASMDVTNNTLTVQITHMTLTRFTITNGNSPSRHKK